jgi:hypothetical protein
LDGLREECLLKLAISAVILASCVGCSLRAGYYDRDRAVAEAALRTLHERLGKGQFDAIYQDSSEALRATVSKETLLAGMRATHETLGEFRGTEIKAATCFPEEVRLICYSDYEKGSTTEMVTWQVRDGIAKLVLFNVSPGRAEVPVVTEHSCDSRK